MQAFYADRGYPDARVTGFDVKLNDKQDAVDLTVTIAEGEPVKVAALKFSGFDVIPPAHLDDLKKRVPLKVGQPRDRQLVVTTHEMALNELRDHGYPYAKVATSEDDGPDGKSATLTFTAEPGTLAHFGPVEIAGNKSVGEHVIRRELTFKPGDLYQRSLVQDSQRRLYGLELFQFANVEPLNPGAAARRRADAVTVAEGNHQRVNFGVGYGTEEKARVDAEYHHVNFLGGARSAGAHARWSSLDRGVRLDFNQPYFFRPHFSLGAEAQQWYTFTPAYQSIVSGGKATLTHRAEPAHVVVRVADERARQQLDRPGGAGRSDAAERPHRARPRSAHRRAERHAERARLRLPAFDGRQPAERAPRLSARVPHRRGGKAAAGHLQLLRGVGRRPTLPAVRRQHRSRQPAAGGQHPPGRQRAGQRAVLEEIFPRRRDEHSRLGPLRSEPAQPSGLPIGGDSLLAFSEELRATLRGNLGGVLFLDAGNVWADSWGIKLNDLRYAVGPGLRYQTPIGPLRFDVGYQLNPIPGLLVNGTPQTRRWRIHFSIGQAF